MPVSSTFAQYHYKAKSVQPIYNSAGHHLVLSESSISNATVALGYFCSCVIQMLGNSVHAFLAHRPYGLDAVKVLFLHLFIITFLVLCIISLMYLYLSIYLACKREQSPRNVHSRFFTAIFRPEPTCPFVSTLGLLELRYSSTSAANGRFLSANAFLKRA